MKMSEVSSPLQNGNDGFVTVVEVTNEETENEVDNENFVTVVELEPVATSDNSDDSFAKDGNASATTGHCEKNLTYRQEVVMYRLPCERLGMGLKFDGGMQATECVRHVYIQSVAPDSPAQRTQTAWNGLVEGDEILKIDGRSVSEMTRVECVTTLKKAPFAIKLYVQHASRQANSKRNKNCPGLKSGQYLEMRKDPPEIPSTPPPVPPRKSRNKKSSPPSLPPRQVEVTNDTVSCINRPVPLVPTTLPPKQVVLVKGENEDAGTDFESKEIFGAEYDDEIFSEKRNEYESDDTTISASTVIERMTNSVTNNVYFLISEKKSAPLPKIDIESILAPFEQLEKEIERDVSTKANGNGKAIDPPDTFKDLCSNGILQSLLSEKSVFDRSYSLRVTARETAAISESEGSPPPPIPPRKSKLVKSHSLDSYPRKHSSNNHHTTPSDEWSEDDVTLSIVGNLLHELEQLPEFSRSNLRDKSKGNTCEESSWPKRSAADSSNVGHELSSTHNSQVKSVKCSSVATTTDSVKLWNLSIEDSQQVAISGTESESVSAELLPIPAPELFDDCCPSLPLPFISLEEESNESLQYAECQLRPQDIPKEEEDSERKQQHCLKSTESNEMANEVIYSLADFSNKPSSFLTTISRLPPDGHEYPSTYVEAEDDMYQFYPLDSDPKSSSQCFQFTPTVDQSQAVIEPPAGFEDNEQPKLSPSYSVFISGNYGANEDEEGDDVDLPPPPPPPPLSTSQHQQLLYEILNEPLEFEDEEDDLDLENDETIMEKSSSDLPILPPIPCKRLSSTASSSSTSTDKTVITVVSSNNATKETATKVGNENLSVRDKIAMFTAKVDQKASEVTALNASKTLPRSVSEPIKGLTTDSSVVDEILDNAEDESDEDIDDEIDDEDPITAIEVNTTASNNIKCENNLAFNYPSIESESNSYQDRPSSSLSASSNFSKSIDDLLGQDIDSTSSDFDDQHNRLKSGSSLSLDRRNFHSSKYYGDSRYSLDLNSGSLDSCNILKSSSSSEDERDCFRKSSTLESGARVQSMYAILESRKSTVSKLKGLVIPQIKKDSSQIVTAPDLPLIYSVDSIIRPIAPIKSHSMDKKSDSEKLVDINGSNQNVQDNIVDTISRTWMDSIPPPLPKSLPPSVDLFTPPTEVSVNDFENRLGIDTEDQESGISSIDSPNVSIHNTPPVSPKEKPHRRYHHQFHRYQSNENPRQSTLNVDIVDGKMVESIVDAAMRKKNEPCHINWDSTDDSEASSSSDVRVLKGSSVEAINRQNVMQSARKSYGGTNEIEAKIKLFSATTQQQSSTAVKESKKKSEKAMPTHDITAEHKGGNLVEESENRPQKKNAQVSDERWMELEKKYGSKNTTNEANQNDLKTFKRLSLDSNNKNRADKNGCEKGFKALTETWKQRTVQENEKIASTQSKGSFKNGHSGTFSKQLFEEPNGSEYDNKDVIETKFENVEKNCHLQSVILDSDSPKVVAREKSNRTSIGSPISRPTSLIETDSKNIKMWTGNALEEREQNSLVNKLNSLKNTDRIAKRSSDTNGSTFNNKSNRSTSVNDLRQMFENPTLSSVPLKKLVNRIHESNNRHLAKENSTHVRMSSLDSTTSESEPGTPGHYGSANSLGSSPAIDHYGSITSLASSTSLISPQELQQLIDEANQSLEESGTPSHEITVVVLQREIAGGSIGITLAGGADYDLKEITVNKVLSGSIADRDGRILRGDRVLSINGKNLKGLTHREALCILKAPRSDCVLVLSRNKASVPPDVVKDVVGNGVLARTLKSSMPTRNVNPPRLNPPSAVICTKPEISFCPADKSSVPTSNSSVSVITTEILKDSSGLGFSLDGGKDSPLGDRPLTIKKIFTGTSAYKNKDLAIGDEIISINGIDVSNMARIGAWSIMKKLPNGTVTLVVNHKR